MPQIAVIGPGAIGGTVAAWLVQNRANDVAICARTPFTELEVETPDRKMVVSPRVFTNPTQAGPADWVLIATKAYDAASTAPWLRPLLGPGTNVAVLQNGVEHVARFSPYLAPERIVPVVVECPAERIAPGKIIQRRPAWMKVPDTERGRSFCSLFVDTSLAVTVTPDFPTVAWTKLCLNCAGAASAVTLKPNGVVHVPEIAELMRGLVKECIAVGNAEGATLPASLVDTVIEGCRNAPREGVNSLLADRLAGRPMEVDARNGVIVRLGKKHGIPTPLNQAVVAILAAV